MYEPEAEEALGKWSSSKYAELGVRERVLKSLGQQDLLQGFAPSDWQDEFFEWSFEPLSVDYRGDTGEIFVVDENSGKLYLINPLEKTREMIYDHLPYTKWVEIDYNPARDSILWASDGDVREIDAEGNVLNTLTTGQGGQTGHWKTNDTFVLVNPGDHYAFEMDWDGNELWSFGESGVSGSDLTHLNSPQDIDVDGEGRMWIADHDNDRVLQVKEDGTVRTLAVLTAPYKIGRVIPSNNILVTTDGLESLPQYIVMLAGGEEGRRILGAISGYTEGGMAVHPTKPLMLTNQNDTLWETSLRAMKLRGVEPQTRIPVDGQTISAGGTYTTRPFLVSPYDRFSVYSKGTQTHKIHIERLQTGWADPFTKGDDTQTYDDLDVTAEISADTLNGWHTDVPLSIIRLTIENTSTSSGTFNAWVSLERRQ